MGSHTGCDRARRWTVVQGIERRPARRTAPAPSREAAVGSGAGSQVGEGRQRVKLVAGMTRAKAARHFAG
jgi:hypothetical protein